MLCVRSAVQGGKTEPALLDMYVRAMDGMESKLLKRAGPSRRLMLSDLTSGGVNKLKMDHLACFVPGMLALGALHGYEPPPPHPPPPPEPEYTPSSHAR